MDNEIPVGLVEAAKQIRAAVEDPGPHPEFHRKVMRKHRAEWPTLWEAIDRLMEFTP